MNTNSTFQRYLLSSLTTFITVGVSTLAIELSAGTLIWTSTFWLSVAAVVVRAAFKAVVEGLAGKTADVTPA